MSEMRIKTNTPFMAVKEYEYIRDVINTHGLMRVLEWGSGASTLWFSENCVLKSWLSVEHDLPYYDYLKDKINEKVDLRLLQDKDDYINIDGKFDFILIDGIYRQECLQRAFQLLSANPQARIILHDSGRKEYFEWYKGYPHKIVFEGEGWLGDGWDHRGLAEFMRSPEETKVTGMMGFKTTIKNCEAVADQRKPFEEFREDMNTYHFLLGNKEPDNDALAIARGIDEGLVDTYISNKKPHLGYGKDSKIPYREVDFCDSHHIMMSTIIASVRRDYKRIVEIGAGYGAMIRLNENVLNFEEWVDIDMPFVLELANWYLVRTLQKVESYKKVQFVSAYEYEEGESDLVIGAHSISELAMEDFLPYYEKIIKKAKYFFYATHMTNCGEEMLAKKLEIIAQDFNLVKQVISEGGGVQNNFYERK